MDSKRLTEKQIADLSFEDALKRLEEIVARLERGDAALEDAVNLYEEGERLRQHCAEALRSAQTRIEKITLSADGKPSARPAKDLMPDEKT